MTDDGNFQGLTTYHLKISRCLSQQDIILWLARGFNPAALRSAGVAPAPEDVAHRVSGDKSPA